eukprot:Amastigsp_a677480_77.p3 type:complete len:103 gc:universal Amastigsp_a677480_77:342-34(-)
MGFDNSWPIGLALRGRGVLPGHPLSCRVSVQTPESCVPHANLSLQHQRVGGDLSGHPQGQLVAGAHDLQGVALDLLASHRLQPERSARGKHCTAVHRGQGRA